MQLFPPAPLDGNQASHQQSYPSRPRQAHHHQPPQPQQRRQQQPQQQQQRRHPQQGQPQKAKAESIGNEIHDLCASSAVNPRSPNHPHKQSQIPLNVALARLQELVESCPEAIVYKDCQQRNALHTACGNQAPLAIIDFLLLKTNDYENSYNRANDGSGSSNSLLTSKTTKGLLPLHYACREQATLSVIQALVQEYPASLSAVTNDGWLPLHMACARKAPTEVIEFLVDQNPEAVLQPTSCGRYALHFACANRLGVDTIRILYDTAPSIIYQPDKSEWNPLHVACAYSTLDVIAYLVQQWEEGLKVRGGGGVGRLALHLACSERQPLEIILHLVSIYRGALYEFDANGLLPLHAACKGGAPMDVIQFLIEEWPSSVFQLGGSIEDIATYILKRQRKPTTQPVCPNHVPPDPARLKAWLQRIIGDNNIRNDNIRNDNPNSHYNSNSYSNRSHASSSSGYVPPPSISSENIAGPRGNMNHGWKGGGVRIGFEGRSSPPSQQPTPPVNTTTAAHTQQYAPRQLQTRAISGGSAASSMSANSAVTANSYAGGNPTTVPATSSNGTFTESQDIHPDLRAAGERLHLACESPQNLEVIRQVLQKYPEAIDYQAYGILPIHTACLNQAEVQVLEVLHENAPSAVRKRDTEGNLPLHLACYSGAPLESIAFLVAQWPESVLLTNVDGSTPLDRAKNPFYDNPNPQVIDFLEQKQKITETRTSFTTGRPNILSPQDAPVSPTIFKKPMGVDEVRAALDAIRTQKRESVRKLELNEEDEEEDDDDDDGESDDNGELESPGPLQRASPFSKRLNPVSADSNSNSGGSGSPSLGSNGNLPPKHPPPDGSAKRPGAVMVNEPGIRPDSAMYRAAYGQTARPANSSARSFEAPPGVQEVRAVVESLRMSRRQMIIPTSSNDEDDYDGDMGAATAAIAPGGGGGLPPPQQYLQGGEQQMNAVPHASSFYKAALEETSNFRQGDLPVNYNNPGYAAAPGGLAATSTSQNNKLFVAPPEVSSFYRAALAATGSGSNSNIPITPPGKTACVNDNKSGEMLSSFYRAAVEASEQPLTEFGIGSPLGRGGHGSSPGKSSSPPLYTIGQNHMGGGGYNHSNPPRLETPGQNGALASSFYREALQAAQREGERHLIIDPSANGIPVGANNNNAQQQRPGIYAVNEPGMNPNSAMYRAAYGGGIGGGRAQQQQQRPGIVSVNEPAINPTSAMYRAAYGNHHRGGGATRPGPYAPYAP